MNHEFYYENRALLLLLSCFYRLISRFLLKNQRGWLALKNTSLGVFDNWNVNLITYYYNHGHLKINRSFSQRILKSKWRFVDQLLTSDIKSTCWPQKSIVAIYYPEIRDYDTDSHLRMYFKGQWKNLSFYGHNRNPDTWIHPQSIF